MNYDQWKAGDNGDNYRGFDEADESEDFYLPCHNCGDPVWCEVGTEGPQCCAACLNAMDED